MSNFNLQQWLDEQHEHNALLESAEFDEIKEVEFGGFGFPHYAELNNFSTNHYLHQ